MIYRSRIAGWHGIERGRACCRQTGACLDVCDHVVGEAIIKTI
ncbi:hypothetical protein Q9Q95_13490 [Sphingomonas sp. DG1-23]|nr:hypothetical protein [Sphingomonas sp. DG1-23]MDP5279942.1 hypothetical protein [Sphingomonas sp. DG1-23]